MANQQKKYDVAIIGSGMGGSTLATVLARQGLAVIVFEGGAHPRFAIGEQRRTHSRLSWQTIGKEDRYA